MVNSMIKKGVQQGDIWKLGSHTLGCGSSLDKDFVDKVVGGVKIRCILTDPPYGIAYVEGTQGIKTKQRDMTEKIQGDQLQTEDQYVAFTTAWLNPTKPFLDHYNACYIFNSDAQYPALRAGMKQA